MRGLDEKPKTNNKISSVNDNYKGGVKNTNTVFLSVSASFLKPKLHVV